MPDSTEGQKVVEEKPQEEVTASKETQVEELPPDTKERTKEQFEKLTQSNRDLKDKLDALEKSQQDQLANVYESLRPKDAPKVDKDATADEFQDLIKDGYVDESVLKQTLNQLARQAKKAEQDAELAKRRAQEIEENAQVKEANAKYPELDPKSGVFDPDFYKLVRNELVGQMIDGKKDLLLAAQEVSRVYKPNVEKKENDTKKQQDFEAKEEQIQRQDVSSGRSQTSRFSQADAKDLVRATMRNEKGALAERLRRSGF